MNYSFKIVLDKRYKKGENQYPLKLRIYRGAEYKEKSLGIFIRTADWDAEKQLVSPADDNFKSYNPKIIAVKAKIQKRILVAELDETATPLDDILSSIAHTPTKEVVEKPCIIKYGQAIIKQLTESGKVGNAFAYGCAISKLKSFVGDTFPFEALTYKKLVEFQDSMLADEIKVNSISVYMRTIRAIYNRAIKEELIPATLYPFSAYRIKNEKTVNRTLTLKEMQGIVNLTLEPNTPIWHWRNYFLLSFCLIGINFADLLTITGNNIVDGRVTFRRKKTGKIYSILLQNNALSILSQYADISNLEKEKLLLPILKQRHDPVKLKKDIWQAIKTCNEYLERIAGKLEISKELTTYYARYTWANIARSLGYSKDVIGQALGHSYGNATTSIYLDDYDNEVIDEANSKVIIAVYKQAQNVRKTKG